MSLRRRPPPPRLPGISEASIVTGVLIWRPMLPHPKSDVLAYARRYGVPYFKDSTPAWSTRGRLRNELLPLIAQVKRGRVSCRLEIHGRRASTPRELH
eukprot:scaffold24680_cov221-Isochrysis_galbana.AAC.5